MIIKIHFATKRKKSAIYITLREYTVCMQLKLDKIYLYKELDNTVYVLRLQKQSRSQDSIQYIVSLMHTACMQVN